jgi:hypothetical protein
VLPKLTFLTSIDVNWYKLTIFDVNLCQFISIDIFFLTSIDINWRQFTSIDVNWQILTLFVPCRFFAQNSSKNVKNQLFFGFFQKLFFSKKTLFFDVFWHFLTLFDISIFFFFFFLTIFDEFWYKLTSIDVKTHKKKKKAL